MTVKDLDAVDRERALRAMVLASDAEDGTTAGDPLELALYDYARNQEFCVNQVLDTCPRYSVLPFDSSYKFMRVTVQEHGGLVSYLKGAPEVLLKRSCLSDEERRSWEEKAEAYAVEGFRVLASAWRYCGIRPAPKCPKPSNKHVTPVCAS
jgi:Ca2+-transporting ATPase